MSILGKYTDELYFEEFPLDFGNDVRGTYIINKADEEIGIVEVHRLPNGNLCGGSVFWTDPQDGKEHPLWLVVQADPLTLKPSILCDCGHHGLIENGRWRNA
jgi:hypothetical protein